MSNPADGETLPSAAAACSVAADRERGESSCRGRETSSEDCSQLGGKPLLHRAVVSSPSAEEVKWLAIKTPSHDRPSGSSNSRSNSRAAGHISSHDDDINAASGVSRAGSPVTPQAPSSSRHPSLAAAAASLQGAQRPSVLNSVPHQGLVVKAHNDSAVQGTQSTLSVGKCKNVSCALPTDTLSGASHMVPARLSSNGSMALPGLQRTGSSPAEGQLSSKDQTLEAVVVDAGGESSARDLGPRGGGEGGTSLWHFVAYLFYHRKLVPSPPAGCSLHHTVSRSLNIDPWTEFDPPTRSPDAWHRLPNVCKALLLLSVVDGLMLIAFAAVLFVNSLPGANLQFPIAVCLIALFHVAFVGNAVFNENTIQLFLDALLVALTCIFSVIVYGLFEAQHMLLGARWAILGLIVALSIATIVLEVMAWREFGWRIYGAFSIDFRRSDAVYARRLWMSACAICAVSQYNVMSQVVMCAMIISGVASCNWQKSVLPGLILSINIAGLLMVLLTCMCMYALVGNRKYHRYLWVTNLIIFVMLVAPISNLVLLSVAFKAEGGDLVSSYEYAAVLIVAVQAVLATLAVWLVTQCTIYFWNKLGDGCQQHVSNTVGLWRESMAGYDEDLQPLLRGAWLGKPTRRYPNKKRFFQLSPNLMMLRWGWRRWVDLHYVDSVTLHEASMSMVIKLTAESDLLLRFPDEATYNQWKAGFRVLMELVLGGVDMTESDGDGKISKMIRTHTCSNNEQRPLPCNSRSHGAGTIFRRMQQLWRASSATSSDGSFDGLQRHSRDEADSSRCSRTSGGAREKDQGDEAQRTKRKEAHGSVWDQTTNAKQRSCSAVQQPGMLQQAPLAAAQSLQQEPLNPLPDFEREPSFISPFAGQGNAAGPGSTLFALPAAGPPLFGAAPMFAKAVPAPGAAHGAAAGRLGTNGSAGLDEGVWPHSGGKVAAAAVCSMGTDGNNSSSDDAVSGGGASAVSGSESNSGSLCCFSAALEPESLGGSADLLKQLSEWGSSRSNSSLGPDPLPRITVEVVDPSQLGPLDRHLGGGAQGDVWRAKLRGTDVAVKEFRNVARDPGCALRMLHEMRLHMAIGQHDNVISVRGVSPARQAEMWLVMEYAPRGSLEELLQVMRYKGRHIHPRKLLDMVQAVARGLLHLHSKRILHRDLKPANIFLGVGQTLKLGDFGHACFVTDDGRDLPEPGPCVPEALQWGPATPAYAAPECWSRLRGGVACAGAGVLAADIWAFGLVLWQLLTVQAPYSGASGATITAWQLTGAYENLALPPVVPPRNCAPDVAAMYNALGALAQQCTALQQSKRPHIQAVMAQLKSIHLMPKPSLHLEGLL